MTYFKSYGQEKITLNGYLKDGESGEELIGATVFVEELKTGVSSNAYGFYSITLPKGQYTILFSYVGYKSIVKEVDLKENTELNIELPLEATIIQEIQVVEEKDEEDPIARIAMSRNEVDVEMVKKLPALFGEPDIIKTIQMMPGVVSAGEGTSGYFVRGGSADQNLILIDEAPIYDPSHFFGLFSVFNADVIKDSELYKGGIPSRFGGRLSSILDVRTIDGNAKRLAGSASLGLLVSKLTIEAPIVKDKSSFVVSGRRSYADLFLKLSNDKETRENQVYFYDLNAKFNWKPNNKNRVFLAAYLGRDVFRFGNDFGFNWGNNTATLRWNHLFNDRLFSNTTFVFSDFDYQLESKAETSGFDWKANLEAFTLKEDFTFFINPKNILTFGGEASYRKFSPGVIRPSTEGSIFANLDLGNRYALDYAIYAGNEHQISEKLSMEYGLRFSIFQNVGKSTIYDYRKAENGLPDNVNITILDTTQYDHLEKVKTFTNLEPRLNVRYLINNRSSIKASYNRMVQYIHLLSNSTVPVPFNTWTPSSPYLDPQIADQVAIGYFKKLNENAYEFSVESFYKKMRNVTDFADHAILLLNKNDAVEYRQGTSNAYGMEFFLQKNEGNLTGFASYTISRVERNIPGVNNDRAFLANYDRRHVLNLVATYRINDKWTLGGNFTYSSGRPFTLPVGKYNFEGYNVDYYTERNGYKLPDFHRLDISATLTPRKSQQKRFKSSWSFAVYNAYNRKNPFTIFTQNKEDEDGNVIEDGTKEFRMVYLFPVLPSISYNIKF